MTDTNENGGTPQTVFDEAPIEHPDWLYQPASLHSPLKSWSDAWNPEVTKRFQQEGFVSLGGGAVTPTEVHHAIDALNDLVCGRNPEFQIALQESYRLSELGLLDFKDGDHHAFLQFEQSAKSVPESERANHVRKLMGFAKFDKRLEAIAFHPNLIRLVKQLLGAAGEGEIAMFQDMALLKGEHGREKPWHQDHAYFNLKLDTPVVGVWIALDDATLDKGCMRCLKSLHKSAVCQQLAESHSHLSNLLDQQQQNNEGTVLTHFQRRDFQICDRVIEGLKEHIVGFPMESGGLMLFDGKLPHGTPTNKTSDKRRALQFHFAPKNAVVVGNEQRMLVFGADGKDAQC